MNEKQEEFIREYFKNNAFWNTKHIVFDGDRVSIDGWFSAAELFSLGNALNKIMELGNENN